MKTVEWKGIFDSEPFYYADKFIGHDRGELNDDHLHERENSVEWIISEKDTTFLSYEEMVRLCCNQETIEANILECYWFKDGINDEEPWYFLGRMKTGVYFFMAGECDYTGFSCRGSVRFSFSHTLRALINLGMTNKSRREMYEILDHQ